MNNKPQNLWQVWIRHFRQISLKPTNAATAAEGEELFLKYVVVVAALDTKLQTNIDTSFVKAH
uniref:Uncharacterized protein n=1 Tax=Glossina brevipalpis TaxID=37001 RepID=A0A1A9WYA8_9MUSC